MAAEDFFARWSKKKNDISSVAGEAQQDSAVTLLPEAHGKTGDAVVQDAETQVLPTQEDVEKLTHDSDYSAFMTQGVDESVKRSAMKKLFSNPHFNIMDGLDVYIEDYSKFEPISPALLASLSHAKGLLDPLSQLQAPIMRLLEKNPEKNTAEPDNGQPAPAFDDVTQEDAQAPEAAAALSDVDQEKDCAEQRTHQDSQNQDSKPVKEHVVKEDVQELKTSPKFDDV
ncbi:DUF3306 domain-containing protein [Herminiimonas sp. NPDC097707]|uniref:DUF3306 domain-containing protein n=1 Tax=Herminiimonas sp. NPDC097707 TaxID=3364007 RepID=UPI003839F129